MSNVHGFDFLRTEHTLGSDGHPQEETDLAPPPSLSSVPSGPIPMNVENKPDLEKQFDILAFLQAHRGSGCLAPSVIYKATGIDLEYYNNEKVVQMLQKNPKVRVELVPDPENPALMLATYQYQSKYATVRDRTTLLAQINRMTSGGVPMRDLLDSYATVQEDLQSLITAGDVLAVYNTESRDKILFPRGEAFLVEMDGLVRLPQQQQQQEQQRQQNGPTYNLEEEDNSQSNNGKPTNGSKHNDQNGKPKAAAGAQIKYEDGPLSNGDSLKMPPTGLQMKRPEPMDIDGHHPTTKRKHYILETDMDPRVQIRRGEAVQVGGQWFRVSSAVKPGPLSEQPARAQAPLSVVSLTEMSTRNEVDGYIRPFSKKLLPMDAPLSETSVRNLQAAKAARERLFKLSHGRAGGMAGQLFGSLAHSSNPATLAKSLASSSSSSSSSFMRKRPKFNTQQQQQQQLQHNHQLHHQHHPQQQKKITANALAQAAADPALALYSHARRHGCTRDVRDMYLATRSQVPEADGDLHKLLVEHKLLEAHEQMRRPRLAKTGQNVDNDGKPKKRRYYERKNQRMTNTHLEGTEIGAVLARAAEKQKQGKSVGDGGM